MDVKVEGISEFIKVNSAVSTALMTSIRQIFAYRKYTKLR